MPPCEESSDPLAQPTHNSYLPQLSQDHTVEDHVMLESIGKMEVDIYIASILKSFDIMFMVGL